MPPAIPTETTHYALVIDAGSSGSRLQVYSWRDPDLERAEIVQEVRDALSPHTASSSGSGSSKKWWWPTGSRKGKGKAREEEVERKALRRLVRVGKGVEGDDWVKRVEPGISSQTPNDIPDYLAPLLSHALQQIPPSQHASTPIYLYATAGMRMLPENEQTAILEATCSTIRENYPFSVGQSSSAGPCGENIRIISGEEEGMWGWVAVNYLMDGFGHSSHSKTTSSEGTLLPLEPLADPPADSSQDSVTPVDVNHHLPTFGFLDMGGASTQLAFSPTPEELSKSAYPEEELGHVKLRLLSGEDVEWPVFVASWLGYGTNRARERYVDQLVAKWRESHNQDPALDLTRPIEDPCLPKDLRLPSSDPSRHPDLMGSGQFSKCLLELTPLLEHSTPCPSSHCLFAGRPTPYIDFERQDQRGFIGVSEYWYTAQQVLGLGGIWDWGEWEQGMGDFCQRDWTSIEEQVEKEKGWLGAKVELSRLQMQCFKGAWISNVLHEGIGIPRLVDAGGNDTLTGGDLGDTNTEAERRAREKGLLEIKKKHHFQSMDEVDQTAISWTLGKMVIEASKAVQPRSSAVEGAWLDRLHLNDVEHHLKHLGIQTIWVYGFFAFAFALCLLTQTRRRYRLFGYNTNHRRGRKPSISQGPPISPTTTGWCWPLSNSSDSSSSGYSSLEEGVDITPVKISRPKMGRIRIWTRRLSSYLRRQGPSLPFSASRKSNRHVSMPLTNSYSYRSSNEGYPSQPASPTRPNSFFIPASTSQNIVTSSNRPPTRPSSTTPDNGRPSTSTSMSGLTSPPRSKAVRPFPTRQMSTAHIGGGGSGGDAGWNDPPSALFQQSFSDVGPSTSGNLGPSVGSSISRKSSRVNLSEMGLAQRSSRAGTPFE